MKNLWVILASLGIAGGSIGYSIYVSKKANKVVDNLNESIDKVSDKIDVDIPEQIVESAIKKATDKAVSDAVADSISWLRRDVDDRIKNDVGEAINAAYPNIEPALRNRLEEKIDDVDISDVKKEIVKAAAKRASKKFDSELEKIISNYNDQLKTVSNVYKSISRKLEDTDDSVILFR